MYRKIAFGVLLNNIYVVVSSYMYNEPSNSINLLQ